MEPFADMGKLEEAEVGRRGEQEARVGHAKCGTLREKCQRPPSSQERGTEGWRLTFQGIICLSKRLYQFAHLTT